MRFFRALASSTPPTVPGRRVSLRFPRLVDHVEWAALRTRSREFLAPWEPIWPADDLDRSAFKRRIERYETEYREGVAYPFYVCARETGEILGGITLGQVRRGVTQSGTIGYWMGAPHAGLGHMTEAVGLLASWTFATLGLHRIEAACLPENVPSIRLLEKVGFSLEGHARSYLCIAGQWRDHLLWGLVAGDPLFPPKGGERGSTSASAVGFPGPALVDGRGSR